MDFDADSNGFSDAYRLGDDHTDVDRNIDRHAHRHVNPDCLAHADSDCNPAAIYRYAGLSF